MVDSYSVQFTAKAAGQPQTLQEPTAIRALPASEIKVRWRDVLTLEISDPTLKRHVEGFLSRLERSAFKYETIDSAGRKETRELSGQEILKRLKDIKDAYNDPKARESIELAKSRNPELARVLKDLGIPDILKDGKLVIASHNKPFTDLASGSNTVFLDPRGNLPAVINIGTAYLRGAKVRAQDGTIVPVTVDGVLANELAHMAFQTRDDNFSDMVENIIVSALGGKPRVPSTQARIEFSQGSNLTYQTLYDKVPIPKPSPRTVSENTHGGPVMAG